MSTPSMYRAVMEDAFDRLAVPVQDFHNFAGRHEFHGEVQVGAPASLPAKLLAFLLGAPMKAAQGIIRFELHAEPNVETWIRFFPGKTMRSSLTKSGNRLTERLGASSLTFELLEVEGGLEMRLAKLHFFRIPCPGWLMPSVTARETGEAQRLHFQIHASVPVIGMVASYTGHLDMPDKELQ